MSRNYLQSQQFRDDDSRFAERDTPAPLFPYSNPPGGHWFDCAGHDKDDGACDCGEGAGQ